MQAQGRDQSIINLLIAHLRHRTGCLSIGKEESSYKSYICNKTAINLALLVRKNGVVLGRATTTELSSSC